MRISMTISPLKAQSDQSLVDLRGELRGFDDFGTATQMEETEVAVAGQRLRVETFINEFWTAKQRVAHSLHEVSYRACFKPQLPRFFIERLTQAGDVVFDPFAGRGTTLLESALLGRVPLGCDVNPISAALCLPRLEPPGLDELEQRLDSISLTYDGPLSKELQVFYHADTLRQLCALRRYLIEREAAGNLDAVDRWIRTVALNRLTGHSSGFFSVYTLPPNQAVSSASQRRINQRRHQRPPVRDVKALILKKSRSLLKDCDAQTRAVLEPLVGQARFYVRSCQSVPAVADGSVALAVTSPPFLDVVDYAGDNWLRCWFCGVEADQVAIAMLRKVEEWRTFMEGVFAELYRVLRPGGHVAFEVGEVRHGSVRLEEEALPCGIAAGLEPLLVLINRQHFTKTANVWGVDNGSKGTNTNRVVLFRKPE
jgi:hypothetical protein